MKLWMYSVRPAIAYGVTAFLAVIFWGWYYVRKLSKSKEMSQLAKWIVFSTIPGLLKEERHTENESTIWYFRGITRPLKDNKVKWIVRCILAIFISTLSIALLIFWQALLLDISYDCEPYDTTKECFPYDSRKQLEFKETLDHASANPVNCSSEEILNGTVTVICYRSVFNIGYASGAFVGVFRIISSALSFTASVILCAKCMVTFARYFVGFVLIAVIALFIIAAFMWEKFIDEFPILDIELNTSKLNTIIQTAFCFASIVSFIFGIPWSDLVDLEQNCRKNKERNNTNAGLELEITHKRVDA